MKDNKLPVALVTGASRGIGKGIALAFGEAGYHVIIHYLTRREKALETMRCVAHKGGESSVLCADVSKPRDVARLFLKIKKSFGHLDVLINNAGTNHDKPIWSLSPEKWDEVIRVNLNGVFYCMKEAFALMAPRKQGCIINMGSYIGMTGAVNASNYVASKSALVGLTKSAAKEFGKHKVCVNLVLPGFHRTDLTRKANLNVVTRRAIQMSTLGELPPLNEVCRFIVAISEQRYISGQTFSLDARTL